MDTKQHMIVSIFSIVLGNNITDRCSAQSSADAASKPKDAPTDVAAEPGNSSPVAAEDAKPVKQSKAVAGLKPVLVTAIGTCLLAWLVWMLFGRSDRE